MATEPQPTEDLEGVPQGAASPCENAKPHLDLVPTVAERVIVGSCTCSFESRQIIMPAPDRLFIVELQATTLLATQHISEYCSGCRGVITPAEPAARISVEDVKFDRYREQLRIKANSGMGRPLLPGSTLLTWDEVLRYARPPVIYLHQLYDDWRTHKVQTNGRDFIAADLRRHFGIVKNKVREIVTAVGSVKIDERLVLHPLDPRYPKRIDPGHLSYAPFTIHTLTYPVEVTESKEDKAQGYPPSYNFFGIYRLNQDLVIHRVIVHQIRMNAFTSFRVDDTPTRFAKLREFHVLRASMFAESKKPAH